MSLAELSAILHAAAQPFSADFGGTRFIQLYLYVHRVERLAPGVYRFWQERAELEQIKSGDQRVAAAGLSLGQNLAGNACVAFSMIGDLERAVRMHGNRGYRYVHFEAGAIGIGFTSRLKRLGLGRPASGRSTTMRCTVISTWRPSGVKLCTISRSAIRFPIRASQQKRVASLNPTQRKSMVNKPRSRWQLNSSLFTVRCVQIYDKRHARVRICYRCGRVAHLGRAIFLKQAKH